MKKNNRAGLCAGMVLTFLLGTTFLLTQVIEYHRLGFNTSDTAFAATFFGLTGLHGVHVFVGLTILLAMTIRSFRGHFSPEHHHGVELGGIYWHFVDVMWIVVYVTRLHFVTLSARCGIRSRRRPRRFGSSGSRSSTCALIVFAAWINTWLGVAVFIAETAVLVWWLFRGATAESLRPGRRRRSTRPARGGCS